MLIGASISVSIANIARKVKQVHMVDFFAFFCYNLSNMKQNNLKYHIVIIGCAMNVSDGERLKGVLEDIGMQETDDRDKADVLVMTTCGVRQKAEDRVYGIVPRVKKHNPGNITVLTGCLSKRKDVRERLKGSVDIWLDAADMHKFGEILVSKMGLDLGSESKVSSLKNYLALHPKYSSKFSAFVPIGNGCNNWCTYCVVPRARGKEVYRNPGEVISEVKNLLERGYREITLIAQNVDSYNYVGDDGVQTNFANLLKQVDDAGSDYWLRFSTSHPKDLSDELIEVIKNGENICRHIHLPVQSGDDTILKAMNRNYTSAHYLDLVGKIRKELDDEIPVAITTDIIVGYPGEAREQFLSSARLMKKGGFDMAYISQYSPRPGTACYNLKDDVSAIEKRRREDELMEIVGRTCGENNEKYLDKVITILLTHKKRGSFFGRARSGKVVELACDNFKGGVIGEFVDVKIIKTQSFGLLGDLVSNL